MDKNLLVKSGSEFLRLLDATKAKPQFMMWVLHAESDTWKLWVVPANEKLDGREFYGAVSKVISENFSSLAGLDSSSIELKDVHNPAVKALGSFVHFPFGTSHFSNNTFDGFYLPDGIILRSDLVSEAA